jgi:hypothetical protein
MFHKAEVHLKRFEREIVSNVQVSIRPSGGIRIWDVRFGGERIAYEIALQEAMISYGGATPSQVTHLLVIPLLTTLG